MTITNEETARLTYALVHELNTPNDDSIEWAHKDGVTVQEINAVKFAMVPRLVSNNSCTPKQALSLSCVFSENLNRLIQGEANWSNQIVHTMDDVILNNREGIEVFDCIRVLLDNDFITPIIGTNRRYLAGKATNDILNTVGSSYAPVPHSQPILRRRDYGVRSAYRSKLVVDAIHILEDVQVCKSVIMENIAKKVFEANPKDELLSAEEFVLRGTMELIPNIPYRTEFHADDRFRLYQTSCYGFNGQSSDLARSLQDLYGVSTDYDVQSTKDMLLEEMYDMGSWLTDQAFKDDYLAAINDPVSFITHCLSGDTEVKKYWNFTKFALIIQSLGRYEKGLGDKPYIGVAVGLDAKCSGPQLAALMVSDEQVLRACGFSMEKVEDAYNIAIKEVEKAGLPKLRRNDVKRPYMAIFYGAGVDAMMDETKIESGAYNKLYSPDMDDTERKEIAKKFRDAIENSFGTGIKRVRREVIAASKDGQEDKYKEAVKYQLPDGSTVATDYKHRVNMDGDIIDGFSIRAHYSTTVNTGLNYHRFNKLAFKTDQYNLKDYGRTGFVNMIQATDALLARLIVVHANRLGAQHIISIHDCFRVNINDMAILKEAIKAAYIELFASSKDETTTNLPLGTDILGLYFKGSDESTKDEYKDDVKNISQFYGKDKIRRTSTIGGHTLTDLIDALGQSYYFDK